MSVLVDGGGKMIGKVANGFLLFSALLFVLSVCFYAGRECDTQKMISAIGGFVSGMLTGVVLQASHQEK